MKSNVNTGIVLDGIKVIHGVDRYRPENQAPVISKGQHFLTYHQESDDWWITNPNATNIMSYKTSDLRVSLVWRSICFKTEAEMKSWEPQSNDVVVDGGKILSDLESDLRSKGIIGKDEPRPDPVEFALMLIDNYVLYPVDNWKNAWFPLNYCALPEMFSQKQPTIKYLLSAVLSIVC